jgi:hypothetical protein
LPRLGQHLIQNHILQAQTQVWGDQMEGCREQR